MIYQELHNDRLALKENRHRRLWATFSPRTTYSPFDVLYFIYPSFPYLISLCPTDILVNLFVFSVLPLKIRWQEV